MARHTDERMEGQPHLRPGPLSGAVHRNIRALVEERPKLEQQKDRQQRIADGITAHLGVEAGRDAHLEELKHDVAPEKALEEIERHNREAPPPPEPDGKASH